MRRVATHACPPPADRNRYTWKRSTASSSSTTTRWNAVRSATAVTMTEACPLVDAAIWAAAAAWFPTVPRRAAAWPSMRRTASRCAVASSATRVRSSRPRRLAPRTGEWRWPSCRSLCDRPSLRHWPVQVARRRPRALLNPNDLAPDLFDQTARRRAPAPALRRRRRRSRGRALPRAPPRWLR